MTDSERHNVMQNIKRLGKLNGWGADSTKVVELLAAPILAEKIPELTRDPNSVPDDKLKSLGFKIGEVFEKIAESLK